MAVLAFECILAEAAAVIFLILLPHLKSLLVCFVYCRSIDIRSAHGILGVCFSVNCLCGANL